MKRRTFCYVFTILATLTPAVVIASGRARLAATVRPDHIEALNLPEVGALPDNEVPFEVVQEVALNLARQVWHTVSAGPPIPYVERDLKTVAYMFDFRIDGRAFPADYVTAAREGAEDNAHFYAALAGGEPDKPIPSGRFRYAHVMVSARYEHSPVIRWGEGLSEFYLTGTQAYEKAASVLGGTGIRLHRMVFTWPLSWYEFEGFLAV